MKMVSTFAEGKVTEWQDPASIGTSFKTNNLFYTNRLYVQKCAYDTHLKPVKPKALSLQCG